jgi:hypothetical protein
MRRVRSARGEIVDFDMIAIRNQLASAPTPVDVQIRKNYISEKEGLKLKTTDTTDVDQEDGEAFDLVNNK